MRSACLKHAIGLARHPITGSTGKLVAKCIEVGVIVPSILEAALKKAGYSVNYKPGKDHGAWVLVTRDLTTEYNEKSENIVARAFSHDKGDALLQAVYAWMKEIQIEALRPALARFQIACAKMDRAAADAVNEDLKPMGFKFENQLPGEVPGFQSQGGIKILSIE